MPSPDIRIQLNHASTSIKTNLFLFPTLLRPTKNSLARAGFALTPSGLQTATLPFELWFLHVSITCGNQLFLKSPPPESV